MIDEAGFRLNVGIIIVNQQDRVFWARRIGQNAWQFPQGGIQANETPEQALYRELVEEVGLLPTDVNLLGCTKKWLYYRLPKHFVRPQSLPLCIGQKQKWFLLRFLATDDKIQLNCGERPEFDQWRWVNYWHPLKQVIAFKRRVYQCALKELMPLLQQSS